MTHPEDSGHGSEQKLEKPGGAETLRVAAAILFLLLLAGLLIFNRTFASIGFPPIYVSEIVIAFALFAALFDFKRAFVDPLKNSRTMQLAAVFMLYGIVRIAIDAPARGLEAARDGVICLYAIAAFIAPWLFGRLTKKNAGALSVFMKFFKLAAPLAFVWAYMILRGFPAPSDVKVDFLNLSVALCACVMGFHACILFSVSARRISKLHLFTAFVAALFAAVSLRIMYRFPTRALWPAPVICVAIALSILITRKLKPRVLWTAAGAAVLMLVFVAASISDARERFLGLLDSEETHFQNRQAQVGAHSVKWRLVFWRRCMNQTFEKSPMFGFGFGLNLTDLLRDTPEWPMYEDSQNAAKFGAPNRHPHSAHVTIFTRLGLIGLAIWIGILIGASAKGIRNGRCQRFVEDSDEERALTFWNEIALLSAWSIYLLAMSFGVVLENPMGGIWFWTLTGLIVNRPKNLDSVLPAS